MLTNTRTVEFDTKIHARARIAAPSPILLSARKNAQPQRATTPLFSPETADIIAPLTNPHTPATMASGKSIAKVEMDDALQVRRFAGWRRRRRTLQACVATEEILFSPPSPRRPKLPLRRDKLELNLPPPSPRLFPHPTGHQGLLRQGRRQGQAHRAHPGAFARPPKGGRRRARPLARPSLARSLACAQPDENLDALLLVPAESAHPRPTPPKHQSQTNKHSTPACSSQPASPASSARSRPL